MNEGNIVILAVGDLMLGNQGLCCGFGVKNVIQMNGVDFLFDRIRYFLTRSDLVIGNLECPISKKSNKNSLNAELFLADPEVIKGLKNSNFNVLSVANNHIMEHGHDAYLSTVELLKNNNITPIGIKNEIEILDIKDVKIAFLGYSLIEDYIESSLYNKVSSEKKIIEDISKLRNSVDLIVVSIHWGNEYIHYPSPEQIKIGRTLIDKGADIILGCHSHVVQGYEIYKNKPIIYGLGNFIFDDTYIVETTKSFIAKILVDKSSKSVAVDIIPVICNPISYYPEIAVGRDFDEIMTIIMNIRTIVENKSIAEYEKSVGDYSTVAKKKHNYAKNRMKSHFVKNLYRYPLIYIVSTIVLFLKKLI